MLASCSLLASEATGQMLLPFVSDTLSGHVGETQTSKERVLTARVACGGARRLQLLSWQPAERGQLLRV